MLRKLLAAAVYALLASGTPVGSATIETRKLNNGTALILVQGTMNFGDDKTFANVALPHENAIVVFQSDGGNLIAGIEIGKAIRLKGFSTYVADGQSCASACALAWLGGRARAMSSTARVGFHAAHTQTGEQKVATSVGNALVGAYVAQLGLPERAVIYVTSAAPEDIKWLTFSDAQAIGIEVKQVNLRDDKGPNPTQRPQQQPSTVPEAVRPITANWAAYGDWIQIFSRPSLFEASQLATEYKTRFDNTYVFSYVNNWFIVAIGPFPFGEGSPRKDALVAAGAIPQDSIIARGDRMVELMFGATPRPTAGPRGNSTVVEQRAKAVFVEMQVQWSQSNYTAMAYLERAYNETLNYYGRPSSKATVIEEKRKFANRWPERQYRVRPDTISVTCASDGRQCTVRGVIDWQASSPARGAASRGTASYEIDLLFDRERALITGEKGTVLDRTTAQN